MRTLIKPRLSEGERQEGNDDVRCSECGRKLKTLKNHIQKDDSFVCASCYSSMVYGHNAVGMEMLD